MSITTKCRFVVGTIDGKSVSYIVDQPIKQPPSSSYFDRPLTSNLAASKSESHSHNRPSTTSASIAANNEEPNEAKINASVTLSNNQLDELMEILQQHQVGEQQQNKQAWSEDESSPNEQYLKECQSAVHEEPTKDCDDHNDSRDSGYYGTSAMKPSLLELKKQQWAKERAEMQGLLSPWGRPETDQQGSNHSQPEYTEQNRQYATLKSNHIPKITHEYPSPDRPDYYDSNYPTDTSYSHTPASRVSRSPANHDTTRTVRFNGNQDEGRLKWGDRGVAVGHLWEPSTSPSRLPEPQYTNPAWLEKSLGPGGEADSNVIYGRKVYIEPAEMEEREQKRKRALENQKAIRQQLEERERQRRDEKTRRALEEKEEEERIRKESAVIEERYNLERKKEQKRADEELDEQVQNHPPVRNSKKSQGWNKKETSPRARHKQRHQNENNLQRRNNIITSHEPDILTLYHPEENFSVRDDYSKSLHLPCGEDDMILLGKEVAVLLAPELERRILMSRSGRDVATQTDITQIFVRRNKPTQPPAPPKDKPIWGANRTTMKYVKQSDKDVYRQRGCSVSSRSKMTTDSTDESDRYPRSSPPQLDRRKRAQSLGKHRNNARSSEEDVYSYGERRTRKDNWQEKKMPAPMSWSVDIRESPSANTMLPRKATNSPPVPALLAKQNGASQEERRSPLQKAPMPCPPSPPVPAVMRQLQEQSLPPLGSSDGEINFFKSVTPILKELPLEIEDEKKLALPEIKQNLMPVSTESSDLLSQLSTIRKSLQNKHQEWQALADEA